MNANTPIRTALSLCLLAATASATDWVVDDDGGPGVDFTTVEAALAAANSGDRVFVRAGNYTPPVFSLDVDRALELRVDPRGAAVNIDVEFVVRDLLPGDSALLDGFDVRAVRAVNCDGAVALRGVETGWFSAEDCVNVQAHSVRVLGWLACPFAYPCVESAAVVRDAYVEFVGCRLEGDSDAEGNHGHDGSHGLVVRSGGVVRFVDSTALAGFGGDSGCFFPSPAGDGGDGIVVELGARLLVEGTPATITVGGNIGGFACLPADDGENGVDLAVQGFVQLFGVALSDFGSVDLEPSAVVDEDPSVARLAAVSTTSTLTLDLQGEARAAVTLIYGRRPAFELLPAIDEPRLVDPLRLDAVGVLDGTGSLTHFVPLPPAVVPGTRFAVQALVVDAGGRRLSNALLLRVP